MCTLPDARMGALWEIGAFYTKLTTIALQKAENLTVAVV